MNFQTSSRKTRSNLSSPTRSKSPIKLDHSLHINDSVVVRGAHIEDRPKDNNELIESLLLYGKGIEIFPLYIKKSILKVDSKLLTDN